MRPFHRSREKAVGCREGVGLGRGMHVLDTARRRLHASDFVPPTKGAGCVLKSVCGGVSGNTTGCSGAMW